MSELEQITTKVLFVYLDIGSIIWRIYCSIGIHDESEKRVCGCIKVLCSWHERVLEFNEKQYAEKCSRKSVRKMSICVVDLEESLIYYIHTKSQNCLIKLS